MIPYPNIDPVAFELGPLAVRWYGLMYLVGFAAAWWLARHRALRPDAPIGRAQVDDLIFYAAVGVIVGGRLGYILFYSFDRWIQDPLVLLRVWEGGMSFHGGLVGVLVAVWLLSRKVNRRFFEITDFVAPLVPIGLGAGRIGNFINGELWGKATDVPWAVVYEGVARHPTQLYQALLEGLALFVILWLYSSRPRPMLSVSGLFLACYGVFRFGVEFLRLPDAHIGYLAFGWLTLGQLLTVPMILAGLVMLWLAHAGAPPARATGGWS